MSCKYYRGKCLFLNGKEYGCNGCPIKKAYNKGVRDTKNDYERPTGQWIYIPRTTEWKCSVCGGISYEDLLECPMCNADMRVGKQ